MEEEVKTRKLYAGRAYVNKKIDSRLNIHPVSKIRRNSRYNHVFQHLCDGSCTCVRREHSEEIYFVTSNNSTEFELITSASSMHFSGDAAWRHNAEWNAHSSVGISGSGAKSP
jgi:hypothetical protein